MSEWKFPSFVSRRIGVICAVLAAGTIPSSGQTSGAFLPTGYMTSPRFAHSATLLLSGQVLIAGGSSPCISQSACPSGGVQPSASAELYDPSTGTFTATGSMAVGRSGHTAILLADGSVLIVGGYSNLTGVSDGRIERYDPSSGTFSVDSDLGALTCPDNWTLATMLADGRVLIGRGCAPALSSESSTVYDPVAGTLKEPRCCLMGPC